MTRTTAAPAAATDFEAMHRQVAAEGPEWIRDFRLSAHTRFALEGLPHRRMEAWRNTSIEPIAKGRFEPGAGVPELSGGGNGVWAGRLNDLPQDLVGLVQHRLGSLADSEGYPFTSLNGSLMHDLSVVVLPEDHPGGEPVRITHRSKEPASLTAPRTLILAGNGATGSIIESFEGPERVGDYFTCAVTELFCGKGADLRYARIQRESPGAIHVGRVQARVDQGGRLHTSDISLGAEIGRVDAGITLAGEEASCEMDGLFLTDGTRHVDNRTRIEHTEPNCRSRQMYKGILADRSSAVFVGRVIVRPGAQQTDADQSNPNLLLSDDAVVHSRPQLEIYADDVRCTHGATVGQLDPDALFYLRSRGIDPDEAGHLLVKGFAGEILDRIQPVTLRDQLESVVAARLTAAKATEG